MRRVQTQITIAVQRLCCAVQLQDAQPLLRALHRDGYSLYEADPLPVARHDGARAYFACSVETVELAPRVAERLEWLESTGDPDLPFYRQDAVSAALREPVTTVAGDRPGHTVWADVYTTGLLPTPYALLAGDDNDASMQLKVLQRALALSASALTIAWPNGWRSYGWPQLGQRD